MESVLLDMEASPLPEVQKALLRFVTKMNHQTAHITAADLQSLRDLGWTDEALYYASTVCALFNFYTRWVDATGVHAMSDEAHRKRGKTSASTGYIKK